jgi:hypothetical protein
MRDPRYDPTIESLDQIVQRCSRDGERAGYFPAMYLAVTQTVRRRAEHGTFTSADGMERFVCAFAGRYLDAHDAWRASRPMPASWRLAFDASRQWRPIILQHLLLGMNAHINLDLGVTAASIAEPGALDAVRADFDAINDVLGELVDGCQNALGEVSPWCGLADRIGDRNDESLIRFSLRAARNQAWNVATRLAPLTGSALDNAITGVDATATSVGHLVAHPGLFASTLLLPVRSRERATPRAVMTLLAAVRPVGE